ncbi:hypothetical protein PM082_002210 [Marasmius tenuissimus]|nr:hypothetical protein PM082_002210 [Marasmius tenuissimus]
MEGLGDAQRMVEHALNDENQYKQIIETKGDDAQRWLDMLQVIAEQPTITSKLHSSILKMTLRLSKRSGRCPTCFVIENVEKQGRRVGGGGFGDVWKGKIGEDIVCLKVVKGYFGDDLEKLTKDYMREAIVWKHLSHPNLLPFLGMYYLDENREDLCLVSPWMDKGDLHRYLKETPREDVDHLSMAYDVAAGLSYLHSQNVVHGDLKGVNVLVKADGSACIGDFGLSRIAENHTTQHSASTTRPKGTMRWLSPELLDPESTCTTTSMSSDIYAYGCVCYEIFAGNVPFHELKNDGAVIIAVIVRKRHPDRPADISELTDSMWELIVSCWQHDQHLRPSPADILTRIAEWKRPQTLPAEVRTRSTLELIPSSRVRIWPNVKYPPIDNAMFTRLQSNRLPSLDFPRTLVTREAEPSHSHPYPYHRQDDQQSFPPPSPPSPSLTTGVDEEYGPNDYRTRQPMMRASTDGQQSPHVGVPFDPWGSNPFRSSNNPFR